MVLVRPLSSTMSGAFALTLLVLLVTSEHAYARGDYQQVFGQGFASDEEVEQALGTVTFSVTECAGKGFGMSALSVRATSTKPNYENRRVVETLLRRAAEFAWEHCQIHFIFGMEQTAAVHREIDAVDLYLPDGSLALRAHSLRGDDAFDIGKSYKWDSVENVGEERRQEAARVAAQQQQDQQRAAAYARYEAERQQFWANVWFYIKLTFWSAIALGLFLKRGIFMRWYYFLTPHPAQSMVDAAIDGRAELDGKAFAEIMRPIPGGRIEKEVRAAQARALSEKAHRYAEEIRIEADRIRAEAKRDAEFINAQDELAQAALVHEKAKARLDALRKRVG
ncbi:MAG: hypothetical protein EPO08_14760 [Rhodospirillaceae bacterium]|nr:MAG: hypothetical protein EPO08_14760 [Rhodospirillaceae bacterium]